MPHIILLDLCLIKQWMRLHGSNCAKYNSARLRVRTAVPGTGANLATGKGAKDFFACYQIQKYRVSGTRWFPIQLYQGLYGVTYSCIRECGASCHT